MNANDHDTKKAFAYIPITLYIGSMVDKTVIRTPGVKQIINTVAMAATIVIVLVSRAEVASDTDEAFSRHLDYRLS